MGLHWIIIKSVLDKQLKKFTIKNAKIYQHKRKLYIHCVLLRF